MAQRPVLVSVSYARQDSQHLKRFLQFTGPYEHAGEIDVYYDLKNPANKLWREDLGKAFNECRIGVLLLTQAYVASRFCMTEEFAVLHRRFLDGACMILAVHVSPFTVPEGVPLSAHQWIPSHPPITSHTSAKRDAEWVRVTEELRNLAVRARAEEPRDRETAAPEETPGQGSGADVLTFPGSNRRVAYTAAANPAFRQRLVHEPDAGLIADPPEPPGSSLGRLFAQPFAASDGRGLAIETSDLRAALRDLLAHRENIPEPLRGKTDEVRALNDALTHAINAQNGLAFTNSLKLANNIRKRLKNRLPEHK